MNRSRLVLGLAAVFAGMTVFLVVIAAALRSPAAAFVALPMAGATYFFWYQASGRLHERMREQPAGAQAEANRRRTARERGGFGAGPREFGFRGAGDQRGVGDDTRRRRNPPGAGPSREEAYRTLGLEPGASEQRVKRAYREAVKDAHPDRGGSEEEFKQLTQAYERLT